MQSLMEMHGDPWEDQVGGVSFLCGYVVLFKRRLDFGPNVHASLMESACNPGILTMHEICCCKDLGRT